MPNAKMITVLYCFLAATAASPAHAASFDCGNVKSARERLICGDVKLSEADSTLTKLYRERLSLLSPAGANMLRKAQRSWLAYANSTCPLEESRYRNSGTPAKCLLSRYQGRLATLAEAGRQIGPFRFNRIDIYSVKPAEGRDGLPPGGFTVKHLTYPQIDSPVGPSAIAWNKRQAREPSTGYCDANTGDWDVDFEIGHASDHFISILWSNYSYCHGTPHGVFKSQSDNVMLQSAGVREATGQDIFGSDETVWKRPLQTLFWNAILAQGWKPPTPADEADLKDSITKSTRWLFTKDGLRYDFDSYEGGCYVCSPKPVTLSWDSLKPLLGAGALVP